MRTKIENLLDRFHLPGAREDRRKAEEFSAAGSALLAIPPPHRLPSLLPVLERDDIDRINREAQDYQINHGGLLKAVGPAFQISDAAARTVGISLHPSPFPKKLFHEACELQAIFQELYVAVSKDASWLQEVLKDLISSDPLTRALWSIHEAAHDVRANGSNSISAAIVRSDYLIRPDRDLGLQLGQVEFNTIACAGAAHGQRISDMHRYLFKTGAYHRVSKRMDEETRDVLTLDIPESQNVKGICDVLEKSHQIYQQIYPVTAPEVRSRFCILMIVQPMNFNIADERPIEYGLWAKEPSIPCFRAEWGEDLLRSTSITNVGTLLFHPTHLSETHEVSVVYLRAGFEPHEYATQVGYDARVRLEASNAVNCPNVLTHLTGSKRVQQALSLPGALERFIGNENARTLRRSFMRMYPLDRSSLGLEGRMIATNTATARSFVLKPSRDGGGHNVYREAIPAFLNELEESRWAEYIIMELIEPVVGNNVLVSSRGIWQGDVIAELGIWGGCVWSDGKSQNSRFTMIENQQIGWSVRSKNPNVNEVSVVKGYGSFDSVALVDDIQVLEGGEQKDERLGLSRKPSIK